MPVITRPEEEAEVFGLLNELSPAPEEKARARQSILSDSLEQTIPSLAQTAIERTLEDLRDPRRLTREQALSEAEVRGLKIAGVGEDGISVGGLNVILLRAHRQNERQKQIEIGDLGGVEQLGLSFLGQLPDPINLLPFGAGAKSKTLAGALAKGAAVGAGATAVVEPAYFALSRQAGIDYTLADSAANIAFGAALGGTFGGAGYAYSQVASARERRAVLPLAARQAANDEAIDVSAALPEGVPAVEIRAREGGSEFIEIGPDATPAADEPIASFFESLGGAQEKDPTTRLFEPPSAEVPAPRPRRGPSAIDSTVALEADAVNTAAVTAKPEVATTVVPLDGEAAELGVRLNDELEALDPQAREEVDAEFRGIDESFKDEATYVSTIRAAVTCALTTGVDNVV